jgi:hypothetical protein
MPTRFLVSIAICLSLAGGAAADALYSVSVNTTSILGTTGSLDFNFGPGPLISQPALADISNFTTDGSLVGLPTLTGDASGALPGTVTFDNAGLFNDYFQDFTFGSSLAFDVRLYGPAVNSPDGVSTSGSAFSFSMFSDTAGSIPALTSDTLDGFAVTLAVNLDGSTTPTSFSSESTLTGLTAVPEPSLIAFLACSLTAIAGVSRYRRTRLQACPGNPGRLRV